MIACECGHRVDIRTIQREIKLAKEFFEKARQSMSSTRADIERTIQSYNHSFRIRTRYLHPLHRELGRTHDALAEALARVGRYEEAAKHLERAVAALEVVLPQYSFELADQYFKMAQLWFNARRAATADSWASKAERVWRILIGADPSDLANETTITHRAGMSQVERGREILAHIKRMRSEC